MLGMPDMWEQKVLAKFSDRASKGETFDKMAFAEVVEENNAPEEELQKLEVKVNLNIGHRRRGSGRPTKRERRDIDRLKNS